MSRFHVLIFGLILASTFAQAQGPIQTEDRAQIDGLMGFMGGLNRALARSSGTVAASRSQLMGPGLHFAYEANNGIYSQYFEELWAHNQSYVESFKSRWDLA